MADSRIQDLTPATNVTPVDRFVLEQSGQAKSLTGQVLINDLADALDGHGGISDISYTAPISPSLTGTLSITMADETVYTVPIANGNGIESIAISYAISNQGTTPGTISNWTQVPTPPTDENPYQWTRIRMTDKTGAVTDAYGITRKAENPTLSVGSVTATSGANASASVTATGSAYNPTLNFAFTLPKGDKGDTGDYIDLVVSFGTSAAAATEPVDWYSSPTSISYSAGNYIWQKTEYTMHDAQTVQKTEKKIIGYIGQNGTGSGTVTQLTINGTVYQEDGTGNVPISIDADDVGAISNPTTKSNGQVLMWDGTAGAWVAVTPSTGNVNTVNNVGVTTGTTNIQLYGTAIPMSSSDNRSVQSAIPVNVSDLTNDSGFINAAGAPVQSVDGGTGAVDTWVQRHLGTNPITGTANDTVANWWALGTGWAYYNDQATILGKPSGWGFLFNIVSLAATSTDIFQVWKAQDGGDIYWRSGNELTVWTADSWHRLANVPSGGNAGDVLVKSSAAGVVSEWANISDAGAMSKWDLLWSNASQNSNFGAQTIAVDLTEYDCVCVCTRNEKGTDNGWNTSTLVFRERPTELITITGNKIAYRVAEIVSGGVQFGDGLYINNYGSQTQNNGYAIPARIYGIKGVQ